MNWLSFPENLVVIEFCALYKGNIETPSDYQGVVLIPADKDWKLSLAKELKNAGFSIDLNKAI